MSAERKSKEKKHESERSIPFPEQAGRPDGRGHDDPRTGREHYQSQKDLPPQKGHERSGR